MSQSDLILELARYVQRVAAVAQTGLAFKPEGFDAERYQSLLEESARLSALLSGATEDDARTLMRRWREQVRPEYEGYVTPACGVGVIAFNRRDEILLIRRTNGRWWYPTGFCEVGISPAGNAVKEAREETGLIVKPLALMAIRDSLKAGSTRRHIYSMLFYCEITGGELSANPLEALEAGFHPLDRIPDPMHGADRLWIEQAREFHFAGRRDPFFDSP